VSGRAKKGNIKVSDPVTSREKRDRERESILLILLLPAPFRLLRTREDGHCFKLQVGEEGNKNASSHNSHFAYIVIFPSTFIDVALPLPCNIRSSVIN
jgi:hypothetical protein